MSASLPHVRQGHVCDNLNIRHPLVHTSISSHETIMVDNALCQAFSTIVDLEHAVPEPFQKVRIDFIKQK